MHHFHPQPDEARGVPPAKEEPQAYHGHLPHYHPLSRPIFVTFVTDGRWSLPAQARSLVLQHVVYEHERRIWLHGAVVMPDHVHAVFTPLPDREHVPYGLRELMKSIKGCPARSVNQALSRTGSVWQREWFDRVLRDSEDLRAKVEYVCANPVRRGSVATPDEYPWLWREWVDG